MYPMVDRHSVITKRTVNQSSSQEVSLCYQRGNRKKEKILPSISGKFAAKKYVLKNF